MVSDRSALAFQGERCTVGLEQGMVENHLLLSINDHLGILE